MKVPPIDLSEIIKILKKEGDEELSSIVNVPGSNPFGVNFSIMKEWDNVLRILENDLVPALAKGGDISSFAPVAKTLQKSVGNIMVMASQMLSIIPGPIGIICSIVNAIVCFSTGNIIGGIFELLGCIPGGKLCVKGGGKLCAKIGENVIRIIERNPALAKIMKDWEKYNRNLKDASKDLNITKIQETIKKIQKDIDDIERNLNKTVNKLDTGQTYKLNFDNLKINNRSIASSSSMQIVNNARQVQTRGISSSNSIGYYVMSPKTKLW